MTRKKSPAVTVAEPPVSLPPGGSMPLADLVAALEEHVTTWYAGKEGPPACFPVPVKLPMQLQAPLTLIVAGRWQPRSVFVDSEINALAESIKAQGVINPLLVFANERGQLELIAGERRLRAATMAGLSLVPVEIRGGTAAQLHEMSVIDNVQRENLRPWEEGEAYERMITELGISEAELARRLGKNRAYIQQRRALAGAAPELIQALSTDAITFGMARGLIAGSGGDQAAQAAATATIAAVVAAGKPMDENKARKAAADALAHTHRHKLKEAGWNLNEHHSSQLVLWAPTERPRVVTEKELVTIATSGARPGEGPAPDPWEGDEDLDTVFNRRGLLVSKIVVAPWVQVADTTSGKYVLSYYSGAEMLEAARRAQADIDAIEERARNLGWGTVLKPNSAYAFVRDAEVVSAYGYAGAVTALDNIEAGTAQTRARETCDQCGGWLDTGPAMWHGQANIHVACKEQAIEAERQRILSDDSSGQAGDGHEAPAEIPAWIEHVPIDTLRAIVAYLTDGEMWETATVDELRIEFAAFVDTMVENSPAA